MTRFERAADRLREQHRHALGLPFIPRCYQAAGVFEDLGLGRALGGCFLFGSRGAALLMDVDSSLDHVFFPDSGVKSVVAVYAGGLHWFPSLLRCQDFLRLDAIIIPLTRVAEIRALHRVANVLL